MVLYTVEWSSESRAHMWPSLVESNTSCCVEAEQTPCQAIMSKSQTNHLKLCEFLKLVSVARGSVQKHQDACQVMCSDDTGGGLFSHPQTASAHSLP